MDELVVTRGGEELIVLPLESDRVRLGRAPTNDLAIPVPTLSRNQCELLRGPAGWRLFDRSGRGTQVDGRTVQQAELGPGARIEFGALAVSLRHRVDEAAPDTTLSGGGTAVMDATAGAGDALRLCGQGADGPIQLALRGAALSIGSGPTNDLVLGDSFISAHHCRLICRDGHWLVRDLDSTNGTRLDGVRVGEASLQPGQVLQLGAVRLSVEAVRPEPTAGSFFGIVSADPAMEPVFERIRRSAPTDETVLITGESGTGKELVARALHQLSRRSAACLLPLNCSALTKELIESELFGHEKGAFTGALARRKGLFEEAEGGTLMLDEIGELPLDLQAKLLRTLESGEIRPLGSNTARRVDTRVLAATHRSLAERVRGGEFREDLYYRICVLEISLPPLRKRPRDIPLLACHFLDQLTARASPRRLNEEALARLAGYGFPGNVRELKNMITRSAILCPNEVIGPEHLTFLPPTLADRVAEGEHYRKGKTLRDLEIDAIRSALETNDNNQRAAARLLGIARSTLHQKMEKYGIQVTTSLQSDQ